MKVQYKATQALFDIQHNLQFASLNLRIINICEELIFERVFILTLIFTHVLQLYLIFAKLSQFAILYKSGDKDTNKYLFYLGFFLFYLLKYHIALFNAYPILPESNEFEDIYSIRWQIKYLFKINVLILRIQSADHLI